MVSKLYLNDNGEGANIKRFVLTIRNLFKQTKTITNLKDC